MISTTFEPIRSMPAAIDHLQVAAKLKAAADMSGGVAHAFNNLLTSVMGHIFLAQERALVSGDLGVVTQLDHASESCRRARDLVQKLLTYSRGPRVKPEHFNLLSWVRESLQAMQASALEDVEVTLECDGTGPMVLADRGQLDQVLLQLLANAREALAELPGHREVQVEVGVCHAEDRCSSCRQVVRGSFAYLSVSDNGSGMEAAAAARAFDPFFSTKPPGPLRGLGLPVVHGIVHALQGHVILGTLPGEGSECRVLLPLEPGRQRPSTHTGS
jgi:two-component system, cell cycle sensor histidine kinase and response regulator CckA